MKTVCKKLLSLMLVAVLLVSAVPMMASATSTYYLNLVVTYGDQKEGATTLFQGNVDINDATATVENVLNYKVKKNVDGKYLDGDDMYIWSSEQQKALSLSDTVNSGDTLTFRFSETGSTAAAPTTAPTTAPVEEISIVVKVDNSDNVVWTGSKVPANGKSSLVKDLLSYVWNSDWDNAYTFHHAWVSERQTNLGRNDKVYAGETLYIALENKTTSGNSGSGSGSGSDSGSSSKFPYSVYLHIYAKGNVATPLKSVTLDTWSCVKDGVVTLDEVKEVVKTYYTAKTSDGIGYDGFYYSTSTTKNDYINNENKTTRINNLDYLRTQGYVHLNVWIDNYVAKSSSSSNADSSNPKTGDSIYTAVAVMGLSVTALAAVYFINKKRIAY